MIKTLIVDDELHCIDSLKNQLKTHFPSFIQVVHCSQTVQDALEAVRKLKPSLIFLDVKIGDETAFTFLEKVRDKNFEVIFTTAYEKYAIKAFRFSAIDYLLKPIDLGELEEAIAKIRNKQLASDPFRKIDVLLENIEQLKQYTPPKKIIVPTMNGFELIPVIDILRCQSEVNYTTIFIKDRQKLIVAKTLKEFEEMLEDFNFFRIHNSHLVNLAYIKSYNKGKGGSVIMSDNTEIEVSTRRKELFLEKLTGKH